MFPRVTTALRLAIGGIVLAGVVASTGCSLLRPNGKNDAYSETSDSSSNRKKRDELELFGWSAESRDIERNLRR